MSLTQAQQAAVSQRGNVLVMAGAGTGKTSTLVERCLGCLTDSQNRASLQEILMVTFTEAAAAEMRHRIRARLEETLQSGEDAPYFEEQLAIFDSAHIGTLHGFCLKLIRQHFYELELDPQVLVLPEEDAYLLQEEILDELLSKYYAGESDFAEAVQELIQVQGRGSDQLIRKRILDLHNYTQTLRDPESWFKQQLDVYESSDPHVWMMWLVSGLLRWKIEAEETLASMPASNLSAASMKSILRKMPSDPSLEQWGRALEELVDQIKNPPVGKKTEFLKPLETLVNDVHFLNSLLRLGSTPNPLKQDWLWVHRQMVTLLKLCVEFGESFKESKRELAGLDFHDLEQYALRLLRDKSGKPTLIALEWRRNLKFVFVDEYQDINEAQDAILSALSREGVEANRFLVGDVKQSIYRFRLADPRIFQGYMDLWREGEGNSIALSDNFRSREGLLDFVNSLFSAVMRRELGGVEYDQPARLLFGDMENRRQQGLGKSLEPRVELHLRIKGKTEVEENAGEGGGGDPKDNKDWENLEESAKDARLAATILKRLKDQGHLIWDNTTKSMRPVKWSDMAVLMRAPSSKMEGFAREFSKSGVPLTVARGGFYESREVEDILSLLQVLDNPLQDVPVLAVLRSPLVGMTVEELAGIRLVHRDVPYWMALNEFCSNSDRAEEAGWKKGVRFLQSHARWRRMVRQTSLSKCVEQVVAETHYGDWLLTQPNGQQRYANLLRLMGLASQFDQFQRQNLSRFLKFVELQQSSENEPRVAPVGGEDAVELMSIHQSKGLEFPIVLVADMGKKFNSRELSSDFILDTEFGLCPMVKPDVGGRLYPSLPHWLARRRQEKEILGEELRLLYVALTRARDTLILMGTVPLSSLEKSWSQFSGATVRDIAKGRTYLDWLARWSYCVAGSDLSQKKGFNDWLKWELYSDDELRSGFGEGDSNSTPAENEIPEKVDEASIAKLKQRLEYDYPYENSTMQLAKTSVTQIRKKLANDGEPVTPYFKFAAIETEMDTATPGKISAAEVGTAFHFFLSEMDLANAGSLAGLEKEAERLVRAGLIPAEKMAYVNLEWISRFWEGSLGRQILARSSDVKRELAFTARFAIDELYSEKGAPGEFVIVQGIADLIMLGHHEIWLLDFKTDEIHGDTIVDKVRMYETQIQLYAKALERIYHKPVTQSWLYFLSCSTAVPMSKSAITVD